MMEQSREPFLSPFPSHLTHTAQSLGHPFPALCRWSVGRSDVLLGPRPSLPHLRRGYSLFVRQVHRCRVGGGALARWPPSAAQTARAVFPHAAFTKAHAFGVQSKGSTESSSPARTRRTTWFPATVASHRCANACIDATGGAARSSRQVGGRAFGRGLACSDDPTRATQDSVPQSTPWS